MNIILTILLAIIGIVVLLLLIALFLRKEYSIQSEIIINAQKQKVFDYIRHIKNQDHYNIWVMMDPAMKKTFKGTDGTPGFIYAWEGNKKAGQGEQEIKSITDGKSVEMEIRFIKPFSGVANASMSTEAISENETRVRWDNVSEMKYPLNLMISFIEKKLKSDMGESLTRLKHVVEKL